jgi:hypothetical protein
MRWVGHVSRVQLRNAYTILGDNTTGKRPLNITGCSRDENMKTHLMELGVDVWNGFT